MVDSRMTHAREELRHVRTWIADNAERYRAMEKESDGASDRRLAEAFRAIGKLVAVNAPSTGEQACFVLGRIRQIVENALEPDVFKAAYRSHLKSAADLSAVVEPSVPSPSMARGA